jgi:class 3 adenylate cyclase/predicted ATPase
MIYVFGDYALDTYRYELRRAGTRQHIEPKVFDLLAYLIQHRDRVITKEELLDRLWLNQTVSESALTYCIRAARQAIGDNGRVQQAIKTIHGRGYRFITVIEQHLDEQRSAAATPIANDIPGSPDNRQALPDTASPLAERRQLTVLFCRVLPAESVSESLDPEEAHELLHEAQQACARVIDHFEGHIAPYLGDGLVVCFGYPLAHEDDAQRAVRTALQIVDTIGQHWSVRGQQRHVPLAVSVGIHTGLVVIGGQQKNDQRLALGNTPNIATQLQGLAEPGLVLISATTYTIIERHFVCNPLGSYVFDGPSRPLEVYQVLRESPGPNPFDVPIMTGLTPLVGREQEAGFILERWQQVKDGNGQVVLLSGESGIGKSRLVQVLRERMRQDAYTGFEYRCSSYYQHSALYPVIEHWQHWLQWERDDTSEEKLHKLERALQRYDFVLQDVVPLFATLLSLPLQAPYAPLALPPQRHKQQTREALLLWLLQEAERQPVCLVMEDLHWVDASTLEWLTLLIEQAPMARLLMLLTFRPDFRPPWVMRPHLSHIALNRLNDQQVETMISQITHGKQLPTEVVQQLLRKTDGVPLFVEETTKMVLLSGLVKETADHYELSGALQPLAIPPTLHDSLTARLDRLGTAKQVAQVGATLGREFSYELLQAVAALPEVTLQRELARLVDAGLLYQRGLPPHAQYLFKHALIQKVAYQSLLRSTKQQFHRQIAEVLEARFPETWETRPELLARHYTEAGLSVQAIPYWQQASQRAMARSAHVEALAHLRTGLALLPALPDTAARLQYELTLYTALGASLTATQGYAAPEVEQAYLRAREICQQVGDLPEVFTVVRGLWLFYLVRGTLPTAYTLGEELLRLAQGRPEPALFLEAHRALGASLFFRGELPSAWHHLEQGLTLYDTQQHQALALQYGQDTGAVCLVYAAWTLWLRGYQNQALAHIEEALTLTQHLAHPFSQAMVLIFAVMLHQCRGEVLAAQEHAVASVRLGTEHEFPLFVAMGRTFQGWALAAQGQLREGIAQLLHGVATYRDTGAELARTYMLALLAELYSHDGRYAQGLRTLAHAFALVDRNGEHFWEAELYRLKAELLLQQGTSAVAEATAHLQRSLTVARSQQAKSLELRAAVSLSRLWQRQGKQRQAHQLLEEVYSWFTEGFDTADLTAARALLETLR